MTTYVLLHGGAAGSWFWKYCVQALRKQGHSAQTVTFTGFAERRHLMSAHATVEMHVADVCNSLEFEDISDRVLVAHSYSGCVAPGVVAAAAQRVRRVVYLDAVVVHRGEAVSESMGYMTADQARTMAAGVSTGTIPIYLPVAEQQRAKAREKPFNMTAERQAWLLRHLSDMPTACTVIPVRVGAESIKIPVDYIAVSDTVMKPMHARARKLGWHMHEVTGDHTIPVGDPETIARMFEKFS